MATEKNILITDFQVSLKLKEATFPKGKLGVVILFLRKDFIFVY